MAETGHRIRPVGRVLRCLLVRRYIDRNRRHNGRDHRLFGVVPFFERRIPLMPLITAVVVGVFGGLTIYLEDDTFIKMKPTIAQVAFGVILLTGLAFGRSFLKNLMGSAWAMDDEGWRKLTLRFGMFFLVMAAINEVVWRTQTTDFWVNFKVFGIIGLTLVFAMSQAPLISRHQIDEESGDAD